MSNFKKFYFLFICIYFLSYSFPLQASLNETLPTYHWSYNYITELQARGFCLELLQMNKPYKRGDVAQCLIIANNNLKTKINRIVDNLFQKLIIEFSSEINQLKSQLDDDHMNFRMNIKSNIDQNTENNLKYRGTYRGGIGLSLEKNIYAYSGVNFNQYDYYDQLYQGYKWRGIAGYTEQAYINVTWKRLYFKIGRDFLKWGIGESGTLIFSDVVQPLDHLFASIKFGPFKFSYIASALDEFPAVEIDSVRIPVKRYLSGHRLDLTLLGGRLQAAVSELILYGGTNETFNVVYLNPIIFYHGAHKNNASYFGNVFPTIDFLIYPTKNWQIYTSLLLDDIQLEKSVPDDLEPDEIGWLVGFKWADPFQLSGLSANLEYARIPNRTYKTEDSFETFIYRGKPLGHPLGNDFDHWKMAMSYWLRHNIWFKLEYLITRKGEGSIYSSWDEPWLSYTVAEGYKEKFPFGIVKKTNIFSMEGFWYLNNWLRLYGNMAYVDVSNQNHIAGEKANYWEWKISLEIEWMRHWKLKSNE